MAGSFDAISMSVPFAPLNRLLHPKPRIALLAIIPRIAAHLAQRVGMQFYRALRPSVVAHIHDWSLFLLEKRRQLGAFLFALNWPLGFQRMFGENLPNAEPLTDEPASFRDLTVLAGQLFNIQGMEAFPVPPWEPRLGRL